MATAVRVTEERRKGINRTGSISVGSGAGGEVTLPITPRVDCIILQNTGNNTVRIRFNGQPVPQSFDIPTQTAAGPLSRIEIPVSSGRDIVMRGQGGNSTIQYIMSG